MIYCYCGQYLDYWDGWLEVKTLTNLANEPGLFVTGKQWEKRIVDLFEKGKKAAKLIGWDGAIREGPLVTFSIDLPTVFATSADEGVNLVLAWKQDMNGTTYVVSDTFLPFFGTNGGITDVIAYDEDEEYGVHEIWSLGRVYRNMPKSHRNERA